MVALDTGWRYSEWAEGGFLTSVGLDGQSVSPDLVPHPASGASEADARESDSLDDAIKRLLGNTP